MDGWMRMSRQWAMLMISGMRQVLRFQGFRGDKVRLNNKCHVRYRYHKWGGMSAKGRARSGYHLRGRMRARSRYHMGGMKVTCVLIVRARSGYHSEGLRQWAMLMQLWMRTIPDSKQGKYETL